MISLGAYEYNPADVLGNGAFAIVYKGRVKNNPDEPVAIKIMLKDQNVLKSKTLLSKEICVLKVGFYTTICYIEDLNHENIVRLYDHSISSSGVYLVMEYCNGGDLSEYLQAKRTLPEDTIRHFLIQIGSAMDAMNRKGFMHRDLKPGNILLSHCRDCGHHVTSIPGYLLSFKLGKDCFLIMDNAQIFLKFYEFLVICS
ncbi:Serine/threonine-protein kinase unc-51 [Schistosoma japonicum]|nr:Serine/threonine-protein kinase unc-51 [Schistosoma japonicum]